MEKNKKIKKFKQWIQDNFFGLIIILALILVVILIVSLFTPINISDFPIEPVELERYSAAVEQRTILIRSISSLISGVSLIIAFVTLLQSRNSEEKRERMQVIPFPAYSVPLDDLQDASGSSSQLVIEKKNEETDNVLQSKFDIRIKNIGLGSLVDYEIKEAHYEDLNGKEEDLDLTFFGNFILGKEETIRMVINLRVDFESTEEQEIKNFEKITVIACFNDLLGYRYAQDFIIESESHALGRGEIKMEDGSHKKGNIYSVEPIKITHSHPYKL